MSNTAGRPAADPAPGTVPPGTVPPDAGPVEPVPGTGTGLLREVGRKDDGRRITYYRLPDRTCG